MNRPQSQRPAHEQTLDVRRRHDLKAVETRHRYESAIVVKDPIAMKYHRMRPDEYFVLEQLDGNTSLEQIRRRYEQRFAPQKVTAAELNQLLFRFHQSGLTVSDAALQGERLTDRRLRERRQRWMQRISGILFIRFPGVDPEPLLRRLYPIVRPILGRTGIATALLVCLTALVLFLTRWPEFAGEFPSMHQWLRLDSILILAAVIGGTKVLHELGHAILCKHFGGECHQIGPMLLVFTPALYCDTSDSWMLPSRWQRAAVGLAGIGTEVFVAAIATFVWASTAPGLVHYISMNVMLVCSVSTVVFNANPLLRYDGYYVLSDLCDVPNLGEKSRRLLAAHTNQLLFGFNESSQEPMTSMTRFWMLTYAVAATVYRWGLTLLILWFVSLALRPYGLESIGRLLCVFAAGGLLFTLLRAPARFLNNPARRRMIRARRFAYSLVALTALAALACWPISSGVSASARILPRQETPIYISTPGTLTALAAEPGEIVQKGDPIATLVNPDVELQYLRAKGNFEAQRQVVESIRRSRFDVPEAANELPAAISLMADLQKQLKTRESRRDALVIRAESVGRLIAAARRPEVDADEYQLVSWTGYATEAQNQNCFMEAGSELMSIATDDAWDAEIVLSQSDVQRINTGAQVKLALEAMPEVTFTGTVSDIARSRWTTEQNAPRRDDPNASQRQQPPATSYVVRVQLNTTSAPLITGATATVRVEADPISLVGRVTRFLNSLLRFR